MRPLHMSTSPLRRCFAALAAASALALAACAPPASSGTEGGKTWTEPDLYTVKALLTSAWFSTGWYDIVVDHGKVVEAYPLDADASEFAGTGPESLSFFEAPGSVLARALSDEPAGNDGLNLQYTIARAATGAPTSICWDDPDAYDEEGCWTWSDYRTGNVATPPPTVAPGEWVEPANYDYTLTYTVFGPAAGTYNIQVRDHKVASATMTPIFKVEGQKAGDQVEAWTLAEIVALYDQALASPDGDATITYDETTGAPASVYLDWIVLAADDEQSFRIESYTPLP